MNSRILAHTLCLVAVVMFGLLGVPTWSPAAQAAGPMAPLATAPGLAPDKTSAPQASAATIGGINLGRLTDYLFFFANGSTDANWQGATKGFVGDVAVDGIQAAERTSGGVPYGGTIYTNDSPLGAWAGIVDQNDPSQVVPAQAFGVTGETARITGLEADLTNAFAQINALSATPGYASVSSTSLDGLNTQNGTAETFVVNITSGLGFSSKINITGDAGDVFVLRWDTDGDPNNGYQGQVKPQSGGAIVPLGGLKPSNFINVAGDINSSGGGSTPSAPYPQGPRYNDGDGALIVNGSNFSGGGFFTGYWLTTGDPDSGENSSLSNGIFVGGWYTTNTKFSMTSGTSGVYVSPNPATLVADLGIVKSVTPTNYTQGATTNVTFVFTVTNYGPNDVISAPITDTAPANVIFNSWTCAVATSGSGNVTTACGTASGTGNIATTATLANGGAVQYTVNATIGVGATGTVTNTASESLPAGVTQDPNSNQPDSASASLTPGASIGDYVWNDINGDGLQNDGTGRGINDVTLRLYSDNGNGIFEPGAGDTLVMTQTTAGDGGYLFNHLPPGVYWVDVDQTSPALTGYTLITGTQSGPDPKLVTLNAGDVYTAADFGYAGKGLISGVVFYDWDQDGSQGLSESGISGVQVCLYKDVNRNGLLDAPPDTLVSCQDSGSQGDYVFSNQIAGAYIVEETQPANLQNTTPTLIPVQLVVIGSGGESADNNYGQIFFVKLGDFVYLDLNANGQQDPGENTGLTGVPLHVTGTNVLNEIVDTTINTQNGSYLDQGLLPGTYTVTAPSTFSGFHLTSPSVQTTTLGIAKTEDLGLDFGYVYPTGVSVQQFGAMAGRGHVELSWLALGEPAPAFNVWRAENGKGVGAVQINPAPLTGTAEAYRFVDASVTVGQTYWYWLEDAVSGQRFGPQSATARPMVIGAYLPLIGR